MWAFRKRHKDIFSESFVKRLHKEIFSDVWKWAGSFRKTNKNIGVDREQISMELHKLLKDTKYWVENKTYEWDELGARFHHHLVKIHCFSNGNGRHARSITQVLLISDGQKPFSWGMPKTADIIERLRVRDRYIHALKAADQRKYELLIEFMRS